MPVPYCILRHPLGTEYVYIYSSISLEALRQSFCAAATGLVLVTRDRGLLWGKEQVHSLEPYYHERSSTPSYQLRIDNNTTYVIVTGAGNTTYSANFCFAKCPFLRCEDQLAIPL